MKKIGFVTPWYGENIPGGAETELRGLVTHFSQAGMEVEVLTTCVKQFASDWNVNYYKEGTEIVRGIPVKRFKVRKRDTVAFDRINAKLIQNLSITSEEEEVFLREMVNSPSLYDYLKAHSQEYGLYVFIPYMFGTTYYGIKQCPEKSVVIPCFHNEPYIYLNLYKNVFEKVAGMIYLSQSEHDLANVVFDLTSVSQGILGAGVDTDFTVDADRFCNKYNIKCPYILYAGRKDKGKNIYTLIKYFGEYKKRHINEPIKLVLIGGGEVVIPKELEGEIIDLGFVDLQDKFDAYAAASVLCQPSKNESFSIVIMESWLCKRPVMVHGGCSVTRNFVSQSNAGLYFETYFEFEGCLEYLSENPDIANKMGALGREYVLNNFSWNVVVDRYTKFFEKVIQKYDFKNDEGGMVNG